MISVIVIWISAMIICLKVKRIYKHPLYSFPRLYNDIALLELGRRIEYDHDRFGDSPSCIDRNIDVVDKVRGKVVSG